MNHPNDIKLNLERNCPVIKKNFSCIMSKIKLCIPNKHMNQTTFEISMK